MKKFSSLPFYHHSAGLINLTLSSLIVILWVSQPSRFLSDIPQHLISGSGVWQGEESQVTPSLYSWNKASTPSLAVPELKDGDHVRHPQFGEGVVVSCQPVDDDQEVKVVFTGAGIKKLLLSLARFEKVE